MQEVQDLLLGGESMRQDSLELAKGTMLQNQYRLQEPLGAGGFGITYKAIDTLNNIVCAIKEYAPMEIAIRTNDGITLSPKSEDVRGVYEHGRRRFLEEASILKDIQNIRAVVRILDYFNENGTSYFVMEYLQGITLKGLMRSMGGQISYNEIMPLLFELGDALEKLHTGKKVFHRDISPENIIITTDGHGKLIDFGNAKFLVNRGDQKLSVVLKPGFAPFEQYSSKGNQGSYTDVYSLAATFYYVISGKMLPQAPERIAGTPYVKLKDMNLGVPVYISDAFDRALELRYENRTQTMRDFMNELREQPDVKSQISRYPILDIQTVAGDVVRYKIPSNVPITLGRSSHQAQIQLEGDPFISNNHCEIFYDSMESAFYIQDHSTNGTYIDGNRLEKERIYLLDDKQIISVGNQKIYMKVGRIYE